MLLVVDPDSTVGGRVGPAWRWASCAAAAAWATTPGSTSSWSTTASCPAKHDSVVTWGSQGGAPYVAGVPVGRVTSVFTSLRDHTQRAEIEPFVDFGSLDMVGVVVPSGAGSDRAIIEADGGLR